MTKVVDVMTKDVAASGPQARLDAIGGLMWAHDCGALPIIDENGILIGIITDRDIGLALALRNCPASELTAAELMTKEVYLCDLDDSLNDALAIMRIAKVRRLPVVDHQGKLVGILSLADLVVRAIEAASKLNGDITYSDITRTFNAICDRRNPQIVTDCNYCECPGYTVLAADRSLAADLRHSSGENNHRDTEDTEMDGRS